MAEAPVIVVGAGLAGLACARRLTQLGRPTLVLESSDDVGGRVRTDIVEGFTIDRGFQVLNTGYPALRRLNVKALELRTFPQAVRVLHGEHVDTIASPLASPLAALRAATTDLVGRKAKVGLASYGLRLTLTPPSAVKGREDVSATQAWQESISPEAIERLLVPFISGVVLEPEPTASRIFTDLMMQLFVSGRSAVPAAGMQELPRQLALALPRGAVRLETPVLRVAGDHVEVADGQRIDGAAVVVATDPWAAETFVPELEPLPPARGVTTYYFAAPAWRRAQPALAVTADRSGLANSVILTATAPEYSTDGRALIATSVFHRDAEPVLGADTAEALARRLHEAPDASWELVATRTIPRALPAMPPPLTLRKPVWFPQTGVWVAGDHRDTSSIQGALVSGHRVANAVDQALTKGRRDDLSSHGA